MLIGLSFLPRFKVGGVTIKRTNIISDLIQQEEDPELLEADPYFDSTFLNEAAAMKVIDSATRNANHDTSTSPNQPPKSGKLQPLRKPTIRPICCCQPPSSSIDPASQSKVSAMRQWSESTRR